MDVMTTRMCAHGVGSLGYARVLVEANAKKGLNDNINVLYKDKINGEQFVKKVRVEYDWKPPVCSHCGGVGNRKEKINEDVRSTANKFSMLQDIEEEHFRIRLSNKEKDEYSKKKNVVDEDTDDETDIELDEHDVYIHKNGTAKFMTANEVSGLGSDLLEKSNHGSEYSSLEY
ncbi:hypothetical protein Tco_0677815 [Tanacetum coccineum]|uniref:Uncharacterized protein n=1 Tax=Tanacetum coccineum TaxID=301880 RepID=A0ABQ4XDA0_9ASTR